MPTNFTKEERSFLDNSSKLQEILNKYRFNNEASEIKKLTNEYVKTEQRINRALRSN